MSAPVEGGAREALAAISEAIRSTNDHSLIGGVPARKLHPHLEMLEAALRSVAPPDDAGDEIERKLLEHGPLDACITENGDVAVRWLGWWGIGDTIGDAMDEALRKWDAAGRVVRTERTGDEMGAPVDAGVGERMDFEMRPATKVSAEGPGWSWSREFGSPQPVTITWPRTAPQSEETREERRVGGERRRMDGSDWYIGAGSRKPNSDRRKKEGE